MNSPINTAISNTQGQVFAPPTEAQQEVWISCLLGGDDFNRSYNLSVSLSLSGFLNQPNLERSLQDLIDRHESLRSTFSSDGTQVCIYKKSGLNLHFEDLSAYSESRKGTLLDNYIKKDVNTAFDLLNGPLYNLSLFKLSANKHALIFTIHHIICDGWSMGIFLKELGDIYSAHETGKASVLPEAVSFHTYALEQKEFSKSEAYEQIEQFWTDQFKDGVPILEVPTDFPRPAIRTSRSQRDDFALNPELVSEIKALSNRARCGLSITLRAIFEILLYKISGTDDIVLGLPAAGQAVTDHQHLISHCVNLLPLRSTLKGDLTFNEYLKQRKLATLDAYDHQQFTFGSLLKKLNIPRDASRVPLVPVVFSTDMETQGFIKMEELEYELISNKRDFENFELFVNATNPGGVFKLEWSYNTQLFKAETIRTMMEDFESLLSVIVKDPEIRINEILLGVSEEIKEKLSGWNNTEISYPKDVPLHQLISRTALKHPGKTAIWYQNKGITYKELDIQANQLARYLIDHQVKIGDKIALALDRSIDLVVCLLAIMKSGAAYIPVDPEYPEKRIEHMLLDSSVKLLMTSGELKGKFIINDLSEIILDDIRDQLQKYSVEDPEVEIKGSDLAYVLYTSGSTGKPKGIAIEHHSLVNFLCSMRKKPGIKTGDKLLAVTTISFDISGLEIYLPLLAGAELLLTDPEIARDGRELLDLIRSEKVTILQATPSAWRMLLLSGWEEPLRLKALCGGEALSKELAGQLLSKCSELWNMYGPTETTIWSTIKQVLNTDDPITIGRPIDNTKIYILNQNLKQVPPGTTGNIYIAGEGLARAYLNQPELTAKSFVDNPFTQEKDSKMYFTGDLGKFMPDGEIQCFGRIDNQVKIRGYRIELGAIEDALSHLDGIKESTVQDREDRPGDERLVAYIVADLPGNSAGQDSGLTNNINFQAEQTAIWKEGLKEILPDYMIPGDFVILDSIPLLPNGKIDRNALPKPGLIPEKRKKKAMPGTEIEKLIAQIWSEFLGVESIGTDDDFFELGGHSLIAVQVMIRLEKETSYKLPLTTLFKFSKLDQFAALFNGELNLGSAGFTNNEKNKKPVAKTIDIASGEIQVQPRTDIEKLIATIWAEYLEVDSVGVYDDFFELGGHSLIAVQVLTRLEKETGIRLPLATLFDHSTVEAMALILKMDAKSITWDSLVPIKPYGNKMPLYIVHGAGLNVLFFNTLAKNMDPDQPVYGLQAKGLNGIDEPLGKIEDMAAYYISEIVNQNPDGPYALAGFSFGGIIAFEMAKQLKDLGKEVKMLAMFDTYAYQSDRSDTFLNKLYNRGRYFSKQISYTFTLFTEDPKRTIEYKSEAIKRRIIKFYWKFRHGKEQKQPGFFGYANNIDIKNMEAWEKYVFTPYNGSIELFRAEKRTFYMDDFKYLGWKPFALGGVNIHEIPGEHNYIFAPPNDSEFARILQQCLNNASENS